MRNKYKDLAGALSLTIASSIGFAQESLKIPLYRLRIYSQNNSFFYNPLTTLSL